MAECQLPGEGSFRVPRRSRETLNLPGKSGSERRRYFLTGPGGRTNGFVRQGETDIKNLIPLHFVDGTRITGDGAEFF